MAALTALVLFCAWQSRFFIRDSFWIDIVWADQFSQQLRNGVPYPRWLPESHGGLGSPVFYFYPPLAFYLTAAFSALAATYDALILAFGAALLASGWTMYRWLRSLGGRALLGALLYMAAPYHLLDFLKRGALAEFCAFAWIPLVALGVHRAAREGRWSLLALSYAGLIATHLPAALIASLFLVAPLCLLELRRSTESVRPLAAGLTTALALCAVYLVPMIGLQYAASLSMMTANPLYEVDRWSIYLPHLWSDPMFLLAGFYIAASAILAWRAKAPWAIAALLLAALSLGVIPGLWSIPLLEKVQFPWRSSMLVEFLLVTAIAMTPKLRLSHAIALVPLAMASASIVRPVSGSDQTAVQSLLMRHQDVGEYLPPESPQKPVIYSQWALDLAARSQPGAVFGFPAWEVRCNGRVSASGRAFNSGLLTGVGPGCTKAIVLTKWEVAGGLISSLAVLMLLFRGWTSYQGPGFASIKFRVRL